MDQKRRRRDRRVKHPRPMELTLRDIAIIHAVYMYRVLSQNQLEHLFGCSRNVMQRILRRLYEHQFVDRRFLPVYQGTSPTLYVLDKRGADVLRTDLGIADLKWHNSSKDLKTEFLEHTLALNDVRIAITVASKATGYELCEWVRESEFKAHYERVSIRTPSNKMKVVSLIPDSYFVLKTPLGFSRCFIEVDRGNEDLGVIKTKILAYMAYHQSGAYERRYKSKGMRVLIIATGARRMNNLKTATETVGGKHRFWFALLDDLSPQSILQQPVWKVAGEDQKRTLIE